MVDAQKSRPTLNSKPILSNPRSGLSFLPALTDEMETCGMF